MAATQESVSIMSLAEDGEGMKTKQQKPKKRWAPGKPVWTADEVAAFIKCSVSYVYKSAERGELPCVRVGRMLRFRPDAVRALVLGADAQGAVR